MTQYTYAGNLLMSVTAGYGSAAAATTAYTYNAVGNQTSVTVPGEIAVARVAEFWLYESGGARGRFPELLRILEEARNDLHI